MIMLITHELCKWYSLDINFDLLLLSNAIPILILSYYLKKYDTTLYDIFIDYPCSFFSKYSPYLPFPHHAIKNQLEILTKLLDDGKTNKYLSKSQKIKSFEIIIKSLMDKEEMMGDDVKNKFHKHFTDFVNAQKENADASYNEWRLQLLDVYKFFQILIQVDNKYGRIKPLGCNPD